MNIQAIDFFIKVQHFEIHKKATAFRKRIEMIERTIKLFLFENDVCFRDKTLTSCKQTIIRCEFMLNEAIKAHNMSCETENSAKRNSFFFSI